MQDLQKKILKLFNYLDSNNLVLSFDGDDFVIMDDTDNSSVQLSDIDQLPPPDFEPAITKDSQGCYIEGVEVIEEHIGRRVTYVPPHASGPNDELAEQGVITSFNDRYVYVRFKGPNGEACAPSLLVWGH